MHVVLHLADKKHPARIIRVFIGLSGADKDDAEPLIKSNMSESV